jgi:hypothetical protein
MNFAHNCLRPIEYASHVRATVISLSSTLLQRDVSRFRQYVIKSTRFDVFLLMPKSASFLFSSESEFSSRGAAEQIV